MANIEKSLEKFNSLPLEVVLSVDNDIVYSEIEKLNSKYRTSLSALVIHMVTGEMGYDDIEVYLTDEQGLGGDEAKKCAKDLKNGVLTSVIRRIDFLNASPGKKMTEREEAEILIEMFEGKLIREINEHALIMFSVNSRIFSVLRNDLSFKKDLEKALYENSEKLTTDDFVLDNKLQDPTIGNWLKVFIKEKGTGMFDDLVLSDFVANCNNCKNLDQDEKMLVRKLLTLYRNIKFFPESMPTDDGEGWEIIPVDDAGDNSERAPLEAPKTEEEKRIEDLRQKRDEMPDNSLEQIAIEEEIIKQQKIEGLRLMMDRYDKGSLERRAIEEEIVKLKQN